MKYNLIESNDIIDSIFKFNNIDFKQLNKKYDFILNDKVFLDFKDKLVENKDKRFLIVGDYDFDGISSTTIIKRLFNYLNINSNFYIPSRLKEGYGLNDNIVKIARENNFDCLFLVDNGIVCNEQINLANSYDLKVFIIDHHEYQKLPDAFSIIHSALVDKKYKDLSAAGLCYLLSTLFYKDDLSLTLAGISTISDVMSVVGFNRFLILEAMNKLKGGTITKLNELNDNEPFTYESLSFNVIPKVNAISRMEPLGNPNLLVKFFNEESNQEYLKFINDINEYRKKETKRMVNEAYHLINDDNIQILSSNTFKEGLCGVLASRFNHSLNKPIIVLSESSNEFKGSGRSSENFNIYDAFKNFEHFSSFGGHSQAIGLSFDKKYLVEFKSFVKNLEIKEEEKDAFVVDTNNIDLNIIEEIEKLEPFGASFKKPLFVIKNENYKKIIINGKYAKYLINNNFSAICFDESKKDINPTYFIGNFKKDAYRKDSISFLIEDLL